MLSVMRRHFSSNAHFGYITYVCQVMLYINMYVHTYKMYGYFVYTRKCHFNVLLDLKMA